MKLLLAFAAAAVLAGCASPNASVTFGDPTDPTRITAISGLKSRDAANLAGQAGYYDAVKNTPQKAIISIKAAKGQVVQISGLEEFIVWAPSNPNEKIEQVQTQTEFAENVTAVGNATSKVLGSALPIVGVVTAGEVLKNGNKPAQVVTQPASTVVRPEVIQPQVVFAP
jgi:hypothetical protein